MEFRSYKPARLHSLVSSIYERKITQPAKMQFLPDGTITLIFNLGDSAIEVKGEKIDSSNFNPGETFSFLSGLHTKPLYFDFQKWHVVGLIMHPSAMKAFFGIPTLEVTDQAVESLFLEELQYIEDCLQTLESFPERAYWLEAYFFEKLRPTTDFHLAAQLRRTVQRMKRDTILGKREDLSFYSGYSKMHTHRIFKDWLGLTPGKLIRYLQFSYALELIHQTPYSLTQIGLESGFYDQAHFIRVFEEFAKMTPGQYRARKTPMPGILPL